VSRGRRGWPGCRGPLGLLVLLGVELPALLAAAAPAAPAAATGTLEAALQQGEHYFRKGRFAAAAQTLTQARQLPGGETSPEVHLLLARTHHELLQLEEAFTRAEDAVRLATTPATRQDAAAVRRGLGERYGAVRFTQAPGSRLDRGYVLLELLQPLITLDKKQTFEVLRERLLEKPVPTGTVLLLPFGDYLANGVAFTVPRPADPAVVLPPRAVALPFARDPPRAPTPWWVWAGGAVVTGALVAGTIGLVLWTTAEERISYQAEVSLIGYH